MFFLVIYRCIFDCVIRVDGVFNFFGLGVGVVGKGVGKGGEVELWLVFV